MSERKLSLLLEDMKVAIAGCSYSPGYYRKGFSSAMNVTQYFHQKHLYQPTQ
jgi:hypothetical protein